MVPPEASQPQPQAPETAPAAPATEPAQAPATPGQVTVRWDDTNLRSNYINACNVMSTKEEVVLLLGVNQAWHAGQREVPVQLSNRIILSPHAAKRVSLLLENVLREHEARFGTLA